MVIKVLIANQKNLITEGICTRIAKEEDIEIVGVIEDAQSTLSFCQRDRPEVLVLGSEFKCTNPVHFIQDLVTKYPEIKIVALSRLAEHHSILELLSAGVLAFVTSTASCFDEFISAIRSTAQNRVYLCHAVTSVVALGMRKTKVDGIASSLRLGDREEHVLKLIADGYSSKEIAIQLHISPSTVEVHRRNIMRKIGLHKVADLTRYAIRNQISTI